MTKPEVHNISQGSQSRTEQQPHVVFEIRERTQTNKQTDRHTDMLIIILRTPTEGGGRSSNVVSDSVTISLLEIMPRPVSVGASPRLGRAFDTPAAGPLPSNYPGCFDDDRRREPWQRDRTRPDNRSSVRSGFDRPRRHRARRRTATHRQTDVQTDRQRQSTTNLPVVYQRQPLSRACAKSGSAS